ncbi:MAG: UDP-3-O-(3-hydroxymyristoyl)glucosamine N-acyltransferase [bacterium ADurb.Bin363]|nr:MAG: UDP-3-O-(3-hydroxymyristoyl)glucosamine N-acyltransferase [bacterium ADurb.Bin363]
MNFTLKEIADIVGGRIVGDETLRVSGIADIHSATDRDITFSVNRAYFRKALDSLASGILCSEDYGFEAKKTLILVSNPRISFARILNLFHENKNVSTGIHPNCIMGENVTLGKNISIYPNVFIGSNVKIGDRTLIYPGVYIGNNVFIGEDCIIYPNVVILDKIEIGNGVIIHGGAVVGSDGFGFELEDGHYYKIPQMGSVVIEDDVEIGANVCIDRATIGNTHIGKGTKLDNLIQIAHNVSLGENIVIAGLSGLSGSVTVGDNTVIAGQVGIADGVRVGSNSVLTAKAGIISDIPADSKVAGFPAEDARGFFRKIVYLSRISDLSSEIKAIRKELKELRNKLNL